MNIDLVLQGSYLNLLPLVCYKQVIPKHNFLKSFLSKSL